MKTLKLTAALCAALLFGAAGLSAAQAAPVSYEYALTGPGPDGTLDFTLNADPTFGNNVAKVTAFNINLDGINFTQANGTLSRLDFIGGYLVNIIYADNLPNLTLVTASLGYVYTNRQNLQDIHRGAGIITGGRLATVPEPASIALLLSGLLAAGFLSTRRRALARAR